MDIREADLNEVWQIRAEVMYPGEDIEFVKLNNDEEGLHLGIYSEDELASVVSVFTNNHEMQFRKFATRQKYQGKGYGSALLKKVFQLAEQKKCQAVWCNARKTATGLYRKFGMEETGKAWMKNGFEFIIMKRKL